MLTASVTKRFNVLLVCGNFLRSVPVNILYLTTIMYCMYRDRLVCHYSHDFREYFLELWIQLEVNMFFEWIISSAIFLFFTYYSKFRSIWKLYDEKLAIDNIWESKNSRDILHYLKYENDIFCILSCGILNDAYTMIMYYQQEQKYDPEMTNYLGLILIRVLMVVQFVRHVSAKNNKEYSTIFNICRTWIMFLMIGGYFYLLVIFDYSSMNLKKLLYVQNEMVNIPVILIFVVCQFVSITAKKKKLFNDTMELTKRRSETFALCLRQIKDDYKVFLARGYN